MEEGLKVFACLIGFALGLLAWHFICIKLGVISPLDILRVWLKMHQ